MRDARLHRPRMHRAMVVHTTEEATWPEQHSRAGAR